MRLFRLLRILKALSHPARYSILLRLMAGPRGFSRLAEEVYGENVETGRIAGKFVYHLNVLKKARLIEPHEGKWRITPLGLRALEIVEKLGRELRGDVDESLGIV